MFLNLVHQFIADRVNANVSTPAATSNASTTLNAPFLDAVLADAGLPPVPQPGGGALLGYLTKNLPQILSTAKQLAALFSTVAA